MHQEIGSITGFLYKLLPVQIYTKRLPQEFKIPCMYFPPPIVVDAPDSLTTYMKSYSLPVKIFWGDNKTRMMDSQQACNEADRLADVIRGQRFLIPMLNEDGTVQGDYIRIKRCNTKEIEDGVAQLMITWDSRYRYERETYQKMGKMFLKQVLKG